MKYPSNRRDSAPEDDLLLAIVHDIRAHLRSSLTSAQLLERSAASDLPPAALAQLAQVIKANKDLDRFLTRLSDYANALHLGAGRPIPLATALQAALLQFPSHPVELVPIEDRVGRESLRQEYVRIFIELIDNALKFSSGRPVSVRVALESGAHEISVSIADTGIGIDANDVDAAFHPLTRLNARDQFPGAGLGLPICKRIADAAGATVRLAPSPNGGAVATVIVGSNT